MIAESEGTESKDWLTIRYQTYLDHRKILVESKQEQEKLFDRTAIYIATGALALSLAFIQQITEPSEPSYVPIVWLGWSCLVISVLSTLTSFQFSVLAFEQEVKKFDSEFDGEDLSAVEEGGCNWGRAVCVANWTSLGTIILGISLLAVFISANSFK